MRPGESAEQYLDAFDRDKPYWNLFYSGKSATQEPSPFAQEILPQLLPGKYLVDMGCGNGRDSMYFAANGLRVLGVDASDVAIRALKEKEVADKLTFRCTDFVSIDLPDDSVDYCYCRFTLHAVNETQGTTMLKNIYRLLRPTGELFIEARSIYDPLCGKGEQVGENAYVYDGHYRRFLSQQQVKAELEQINLRIRFCEVSDAFAPYKGENPPVLRVIAQKGDKEQ